MVLRVRHAQLAVGQRRDAARAVEAQALTAAAAVGAQSQAVVLTTDGEAVLEDGALGAREDARWPRRRGRRRRRRRRASTPATRACRRGVSHPALSRLLGSGLLCLLRSLSCKASCRERYASSASSSIAEQRRATCLSTEAAPSCEITPAPPERWTCETGPRLRGDNSEEELGRAVSLPQ